MSRRIVPIIWPMLAAVVIGASVGLAARAHADDNFVSPIRECLLPDGDPQGYPCVHTEANGKQYIDWSSAHRQYQNSLLPPISGEYWAACTRMGDCP